MPTFRYEVLDGTGQVIETLDLFQASGDPPLTQHPVTGEPMRRILSAPNINSRYADWKNKLDPDHLSRHGFARYERDPGTGRFHRTGPGEGPDEIRPNG